MSGISGATSNVKSIGPLELKKNLPSIQIGHDVYNVNSNNYNMDYIDYDYNTNIHDYPLTNGYISNNPIIIMKNVINGSIENDQSKDSFGSWFIEHGDSRFKVFNDNRIKFDQSKGEKIGANTFDHVFAALMPYGSKEGAKYALRAYKQTATNRKGNFYIQHDENDVKLYHKVDKVVDGKTITEVETVDNPAMQREYASKYQYNNDNYVRYKNVHERNFAGNYSNQLSSGLGFMRNYMSATGGISGMRHEVRQNMGNGSFLGDFKQLVKEGRNANSIRGDKTYLVGFNTKMANVTVYRKGLWNAKDIEHDVLYGETDAEYKEEVGTVRALLDESYQNRQAYLDSYGRSSGYTKYVDVGDGTAEATFFKQRAEGGFVSSNGYADVHGRAYEEFNFLQAKAIANVEFGIDHINLNAQVSVCVASVEAGASSEFETRIGDCNLHLASAHINGDARALEADAKAFVTAGIYKGEDGKYHADAGIRLEANAELCSAGISGGTDILGIGTSASARVKIGAGAQCSIGFQDGEFKFKIGLAIGVGFEFGGSIDLSGLVNNIQEILKSIHISEIGTVALTGLLTAASVTIDVVGSVVSTSVDFVCNIVVDLPSPMEIAYGVKAFVTHPIDTISGWLP